MHLPGPGTPGVSERALSIAALCRDHRGLVTILAAAGKVGAQLLLMNTGFAKPQLADVATREKVNVLIYDEEFTDLVSAIDPGVRRFLAWTDERSDSRCRRLAGGPDRRDLTRAGCRARQAGRHDAADQRHHRHAQGRTARQDLSPVLGAAVGSGAAAPRSDLHAGRADVPRHRAAARRCCRWRWATAWCCGASSTPRRRCARSRTTACDVLVVVPTMLQRILAAAQGYSRSLRHVVAQDHLRLGLGHATRPGRAHPRRIRSGALQPVRLNRTRGDDRRDARGPAARSAHRGPGPGRVRRCVLYDDAG